LRLRIHTWLGAAGRPSGSLRKPRGWKRSFLALLIVFCALGYPASFAAAANGDGTGPSAGTPGAKPLNFVSATLLDEGTSILDAKDVPLEPQFRLLFDKNVVNSTVWGINRECFTLSTESGGAVPLEVTKVDDSIDFSQRQVIFVKPLQKLQPGTSYLLKVAPQLLAKNGVSTLGGTTSGRGITIVFATAAGPAASGSPATGLAGGQPTSRPAPAAPGQPAGKPGAGAAEPPKQPAAGGGSAAASGGALGASPAPAGSGAAAGGGSAAAGSSAAPSAAASPHAAAAPGAVAGSPAAAGSPDAPEASGAGGKQAAAAPAGGQALAATDLGDGSDPHWQKMMIIGSVLLAGWILAEVFYFRRWRKRPRKAA